MSGRTCFEGNVQTCEDYFTFLHSHVVCDDKQKQNSYVRKQKDKTKNSERQSETTIDQQSALIAKSTGMVLFCEFQVSRKMLQGTIPNFIKLGFSRPLISETSREYYFFPKSYPSPICGGNVDRHQQKQMSNISFLLYDLKRSWFQIRVICLVLLSLFDDVSRISLCGLRSPLCVCKFC